MKSERLSAGDPCLAKGKGLKAPWFKAVVVRALLPGKGYEVRRADASDLDEPMRVREACCKRVTSSRKTTSTAQWFLDAAESKQKSIAPAPIEFPKAWGKVLVDMVPGFAQQPLPRRVAQPKPVQPWRSEAYKSIVRAQRCCNCGKAPPSDPDHYGKRGTGQKCSDALTTGLCRKCHSFRTGMVGHIASLPDPLDSARKGKPVLRSPEETADIIAKEQVRLMSLVLGLLPVTERVDALRRAVEGIPEERLREITKRSARSE